MTKDELLDDIEETLRVLEQGKIEYARNRLACVLRDCGRRVKPPRNFDQPKGKAT